MPGTWHSGIKNKVKQFFHIFIVYLPIVEMNRYLLAALYVMAGCAVTIPLKAQESIGILKADRCRLVITNTLKVVAVYLEESEEKCDSSTAQPSKGECFPISYEYTTGGQIGTLCHVTHKIRAPGND